MKKILPEKPSDLIELALNDLIKVEHDKRYKIDMNEWHRPNGDGICVVCQAGAVIAKTFKTPPTSLFDFFGASTWDNVRLDALDDIRAGNFEGFEASLELNTDLSNLSDVYYGARLWITYDRNPELYKMNMQTIAEFYKSIGF